MKKIFIILLCAMSLSCNAQYLKSQQIMIFAKQTDLAGVAAGNGQLAMCNDVKITFTYDSINVMWMPLARTVVKKSIVLVTGTSTGATKVYTMEASGLNFYPITVIFRAVNISGITLKPTVSIGTNSTAYDNIVSAALLPTVLSTMSATGGAPQMANLSYPIAGGTGIYANVSVAGIATSYTFYVEIIGFYDN